MKNRKLVVFCFLLFCLALVSTTISVSYFVQYQDLQDTVRSGLEESSRKKDLFEQIILQYEMMDFKIFAFEKKYAEFAKIVNTTFEEARKNKLSPYTVLSVIQVESNFDPAARSSVANGLMQINLGAWKNYFNIDEKRIHDIGYNIALGCKILRHYLDKSDGDLPRALYLYNNGYGFHNDRYVPKVQNSMYSRANK